MLAAYLEREDVQKLMASFGYGDLELEEILDRSADGYQEHMDGKRGFPLKAMLRPVVYADII